MLQDTSIKAYREDALPLGEATNSELASYLGWTINRVTPRIYELRKADKVAETGKRPCKVTGRSAYSWAARPAQPKLL